jgi:predicted unusual protein kinase regulating ubiquinone biosynthesis (AarF/ABC1/UbiB family)
MIDKIKANLKEIIATVTLIGTIGGGFIKYGEIMSKIDSIDPAKASEMRKEFAVLQKEVDLVKVQIKELRQLNSNPLAR